MSFGTRTIFDFLQVWQIFDFLQLVRTPRTRRAEREQVRLERARVGRAGRVARARRSRQTGAEPGLGSDADDHLLSHPTGTRAIYMCETFSVVLKKPIVQERFVTRVTQVQQSSEHRSQAWLIQIALSHRHKAKEILVSLEKSQIRHPLR